GSRQGRMITPLVARAAMPHVMLAVSGKKLTSASGLTQFVICGERAGGDAPLLLSLLRVLTWPAPRSWETPVSGMANCSRVAATAAHPAKVRKAALYPTGAVTRPATVVERAAPMPCAVIMAPCAVLNRAVPRIRSATMVGKIAP